MRLNDAEAEKQGMKKYTKCDWVTERNRGMGEFYNTTSLPLPAARLLMS